MILFGDPKPTSEQLAQLAMAGDTVTVTPPPVYAAPAYPPLAAQPWIAIDIETANGRPEEAERWMRLHYTPPSNYKTAEACGKAFLEMREKKTEKRALLDSSPVVIVTVQTASAGLYGLHCLGAAEPAPHGGTGGTVQGFATAREMLIALRQGLDGLADEGTTIVGHNIIGFDLPKLRWAYLKAGLRMPYALAPSASQPVFDSMRQYGKHFSQVEKPFIALADLLEEFGIPSHKSELDGSKVPGMVEKILAGEREHLDPLLTYALKDAAVEAHLFLAMTGQLPDRSE